MNALAAQLEQGAVNFGDAIAIIAADGQTLSYAELRDQTKAIAAYLSSLEVRPGEPVAISLPHGMEQAICLLGVASYTACLPLDPTMKNDELERLLSEADAVAIICETPKFSEMKELVAKLGIVCIQLEAKKPPHRGRFGLYSDTALSPRENKKVLNSNHAVFLCTSGSTSMPKLVPQSQEALVAVGKDLAEWFRLDKKDRCLGCMALFHGNGLYAGLLPTLLSGGSYLCLESFAPDEFFRCLNAFHPTWLTTIPTYLQGLLRHTNQNKESIPPNSLRFIRAGSAHLPIETKKAVMDLFSVNVIAGYGSAEAAHITNNPLPPKKTKDGSVGLPSGNEVKIIDTEGNQLGSGEVGEVLVRGRSVTTGYLGSPIDNAELFIDGWLRTGDRGRFDAEGYLTLVGRTKQMINRGGESISPLEIQNVIHSHPLVAEAAVFSVPHPTLGENVAAAIVLHPDSELSQEALQKYLGERLSSQKVPYRIIELKEFPMNNIGKVQNAQLAELFVNMRPSTIEARNREEEIIARIWSETLAMENIGVTDHFIDLGGDSITALSILSKINSKFAIDLQLSDVLMAATVEELNKVVAGRQTDGLAGKEATQTDPIPKRSSSEPAPLSFSETGLYLMQCIEPDNTAYNESLVIRFIGELDASALEKSLQAIVRRHETLRTTYEMRGQEPSRIITKEMPFRLRVDDLRTFADSYASSYWFFEDLADKEIKRPFDLSNGPLLRSRLFRIDDQTHILLLTLHHIVTDGWSTGVIIRDLGTLYSQTVNQVPADLPELSLQYADYADWQRSREAVFENHLRYWRKQLAGQPPRLSLPTDRPLPVLRSPKGSVLYHKTTGQLGETIRELSKQLQATQFVTLETAFKVLLYHYCESTDISIGAPAANRVHNDLEHMVGFFVSMLVLRSDLSGNPTFAALIKRERETCYAAYKHQEVPFQTVVANVPTTRLPGVHPLFQVVFSLRTIPPLDLSETGVRGERIFLHNGAAKYDLSVDAVFQDDGEIELCAEYSQDLFDEKSVGHLLKSYENLLKRIAEDPNQCIDDLK